MKQNPARSEFHQAFKEVLESLRVVMKVNNIEEELLWKVFQSILDV